MKRFLVLALLGTNLSFAQQAGVKTNIEPVLVKQGSPYYPPLAKAVRVFGQVKLEFVVNNTGDVVSAMAVSGPAMLAPAAVDTVRAWKFQMPKRDSLEDLHLETLIDYRLGGDTLVDPPPVVFESFHRVIITAQTMVVTGGETISCPDFKSLPPLGTNENAAFVELSRALCYVDWANPGATPLMHAASQPSLERVQRLLRDGASAGGADAHGWTPLMYAAVHGDPAVLRVLLAAGADSNQGSLLGNTPMMIAASQGEFHKELIRAGASLNAQNTAGTTTLMILADKAGSREIRAALKSGADATFQDKGSRTALDYLRLAHCNKSLIPASGLEAQSTPDKECPSLDDDGRKSEHLLITAQAGTKTQ